MARPQSPDYDDRRRAIVDAAAELFARKGFSGTSIADIAAACRTAKSLIYHYFPSKNDILREAMEEHLDALVGAARRAGDADGPERRLRALAEEFMSLYVGAANRHKVLLNELDNLAPADRAAMVARQRSIIDSVEQVIGDLAPDAGQGRRALAMLFFGMINWTHTWFRPDGLVSGAQLADMAAGLMIGGLPRVQES